MRWSRVYVWVHGGMANYVQESKDRFSYVYSCDLSIPFRIKIGTLEGKRQKKSVHALLEDPLLQFSGLYQSEYSDLYVVCQIFANGKPLTLSAQTAYKAFSNRWNWNEWITLPIHYKDVPQKAVLTLTIYDILGPRKSVAVGGTTIPIFGKHGCLRRGIHDLRVWPDREADGSLKNSTPGERDDGESGEGVPLQMARLSKLVQKHRKGRMMTVDWLDRLTFREIEVINEREKRESNFMYINVEFPKFHYDGFEYSVVYFERDGELEEQLPVESDLRIISDPEWDKENLVEHKHHRLTHTMRKGRAARDIKPTARIRDIIMRVVNLPPTQVLSSTEKFLIWQFRYYLMQEKAALPKFLQSVSWQSKQEADEALDLLYKWQPLNAAEALELLTPTYTETKVRKYAISRLKCADNDELLLYLLQLVQALRYEQPAFFDEQLPPQEHSALALSLEETYSEATKTYLERELAEAVQEEDEEAVEMAAAQEPGSDSDSDDGEGPYPFALQQPSAQSITNSLEASLWSLDISSTSASSSMEMSDSEFPDLASFLVARACRSTELASYFYWYLSVECTHKDNTASIKYERIRFKFLEDLRNSSKPKWKKRYHMLTQQDLLISELREIMTTINNSKEDRPRKIQKLRSILSNRPDLLKFRNPIRLPLEPSVKVTGILSEQASLFKSALIPAKLGFNTEEGDVYWVMFKLGDDLRQDQLILQLICLMDRLLRRENLDLKLSPYNVLACSGMPPYFGFVQLVPKTHAVAHVLSTYKTIQNFFKTFAPNESAPYGIQPEVMDTYVKSCAGYSVITYLLGVGDRHLDNLLLSESGHLIHVDFGYILGRDPKVFPPPMKLNKEMVEGMGGTSSVEYQRFREHCYNAFLALRRSANLILNLFSLMLDAGVPDIALEPDKTVQKVKDKFCLDYNEEEAVQHLQNLIDISVTAVMAVFVERMHKFAQYWRK